MTNQVALALGLGRLSSVVCDRRAHIYMSEAGGIAANTGATVYPVTADNGHYMTAEEVMMVSCLRCSTVLTNEIRELGCHYKPPPILVDTCPPSTHVHFQTQSLHAAVSSLYLTTQ